MIKINQKGSFPKITKYLDKCKQGINIGDLDRYGREGVEALASATPVNTGKTSNSWSYKIIKNKKTISISFNNSNINKGVPIAIILQYGHGTKNGGWVEGRDYINPAIQPIFDKIAKNVWKEVIKHE